MSVSINAYAQWVIIKLVNDSSKTSYKVQSVYLSWGKFYSDGNKDHEIGKGSIEGHVIGPGQEFQINSCGRSDASSGTTGGFDIVDASTGQTIRSIYWDCPWGSKTNTFRVTGSNRQWMVEHEGENLYGGALGTITVDAYKKGN